MSKQQTRPELGIPEDQRESLYQALKGVEDRLTQELKSHTSSFSSALDDHEQRILQLERTMLEYRGFALEVRVLADDVKKLLAHLAVAGERDLEYEKRLLRIERVGSKSGQAWGIGAGAVMAVLANLVTWLLEHIPR